MTTVSVSAPCVLPNRFRERTNPRVRADSFAVLNAGLQKFPRDPAIHVDARDDERSEEIALAAFVDAEMRLEHFRRMHFLVAELRLAQNLRFELELHELLDPLALQQHLRSLLVNGDAQLVLLREEKRVRPRREFERQFLEQERAAS